MLSFKLISQVLLKVVENHVELEMIFKRLKTLLQFMVFSTSFLVKKYPKVIGIKKTTLSIWTSHLGHVLRDWAIKLDLVILIDEMLDYSISR